MAREKREEGKRTLPSHDALFRLVTDHTCGRNLLVFKVSFVKCGMRMRCCEFTLEISEPTVVIAQTGSKL